MPCRIVTGEIDGAVVRYRGGTVAALREAWDADPAFVTTSEVDPTCWAEHWSWPSPTTTGADPPFVRRRPARCRGRRGR